MPFALDDDDVFAAPRTPATAVTSRPLQAPGAEAARPEEPSPPAAGSAPEDRNRSATRISGIGALV
ncbi:MAG: hypothetical protein U0547_04210 [Dehalococcoidia bacterium]